MQLNRFIFWDINPDKLDYEKNARFIIERVVTSGTMSDWRQIRDYYGWDRLKQECLQIRSLDYKTLVFLAAIFEEKIESFRCFSNLSSNPELFPF